MIADPLYVAARATLLEALTALDEQRAALVLVGAQAIYLHTGAADLAVAEHTADADLVVNPAASSRPPGSTVGSRSAFSSPVSLSTDAGHTHVEAGTTLARDALAALT